VSDKTAIAQAIEAIGSYLWLGNNLHNIKAAPDQFREMYEAANQDGRAAYDRLVAIEKAGEK
jgi:hypothetical protein